MSRFLLLALALGSVFFHMWLVFAGLLPNLVTRPIHLALALPWVFLVGQKTPIQKLTGWVLATTGISICMWVAYNRVELMDQYGSIETSGQFLWSIALVLIVLEMARRHVKLALPLVALIALSYGILGQYLPGEFGHPVIPADAFWGTLVLTEGGVWGPLTGISLNVIAVFIILGAFVSAGEGGSAFMSLATRIAGKHRAGPAKVSVLASAFFGSISGSASANVASTGAITMPTMKRLGYPASFAGAVEAVASTGGQIMPPLMGAGAFMMVELLRINYNEVMAAAILPALLFFFCVWVGVDHFARRNNLIGLREEDLPRWNEVGRLAIFFVLPFGVLLLMLFFTGYTAQYGAAIATIITALMLIADRKGLSSAKTIIARFELAFLNAAKQMSTVASIVICAGVIIGVLNMTGLGVKVTSAILGLSGGSLYIALCLTALACLILGMEVPTTAAYAICISVAGPALEQLGLPALYAHLFVFWYALLSTVTPPVCGTVFIAAGMCGAPWLSVANRAMRLGVGLYIVPLALVANPALIQLIATPFMAVLAAIKIGVGLWLVSFAVTGQSKNYWQPIIAFVFGILTIFALGVGQFS